MVANLNDIETARLEEFLAPPRIAVLATLNASGSPQISPIWYRYSDDRITMSTTTETVKSRNILRDGRASVCVYSDPEGLEYAALSGTATVIDDSKLWAETRAIVDRYELPDRADARMRRLERQDRVILSLEVDRVHFSRSDGRRGTRFST
jgi:PPOX class probable F420-dependent enzyme